MTEKNFNVYSFNANGLGEKNKRSTILNWIKTHHQGVLFLQETHSFENSEESWKQDSYSRNIYFSHGTSVSRGVCIILPKNADVQILEKISDLNGRLLLLHAIINSMELILVNIYAPTKDKIKEQSAFVHYVHDTLINFIGKTIIIGGDWNIYLDPKKDKTGGIEGVKSESSKTLSTMIEHLGLIDIYRFLHPHGKHFTWRNKGRSGLVQSRLDFFLVSQHLKYQKLNNKHFPGLMSDHSLINLSFNQISSWNRGRGFWKLNLSLLKDLDYVKRVNEELEKLGEQSKDFKNKSLFWDFVKCKIRGLTVSYASYKSKKRKEKEILLLKQLQELEVKVSETPTPEYLNQFTEIKSELENFYNEKTKASMIRARADFIENDEKNTKYFLDIEKRNYSVKCIKCLKTPSGQITDEEKILEEEKRFYKKLYSENDKDINYRQAESYFLENEVPKLSHDKKMFCDQDIHENECKKALSELKNNKTPGCDGLPVEFYKFFWNRLQTLILDSFHWSFQNRELSLDQKRGIINLVPKPGKDLCQLKNWRPISLLNVDYKILTKVLAIRLQSCLDEIICSDQVGYIKNRFIGENIRTTVDIMTYCKMKKLPLLITQIDFEKAFDSLS